MLFFYGQKGVVGLFYYGSLVERLFRPDANIDRRNSLVVFLRESGLSSLAKLAVLTEVIGTSMLFSYGSWSL